MNSVYQYTLPPVKKKKKGGGGNAGEKKEVWNFYKLRAVCIFYTLMQIYDKAASQLGAFLSLTLSLTHDSHNNRATTQPWWMGSGEEGGGCTHACLTSTAWSEVPVSATPSLTSWSTWAALPSKVARLATFVATITSTHGEWWPTWFGGVLQTNNTSGTWSSVTS